MVTLLLPNDSAMHSHSAHSHPRPLAIEENMPWFWIWFRTWRLSWFGEGGIMCNEEEEDSQEATGQCEGQKKCRCWSSKL